MLCIRMYSECMIYNCMYESYVYDTLNACSYHILWLNHSWNQLLASTCKSDPGHNFIPLLVPILRSLLLVCHCTDGYYGLHCNGLYARTLGTASSPVFDIFLLKERLCTTLGEALVRPQSFLVQLDDNAELNQEWHEQKEPERCLETLNGRAGTTR